MTKNYYKLDNRQGIVSIIFVLILAVLIIAVSIEATSITFNQSASMLDFNQSAKAYAYAEAGARDALERIARKYDFSETSWDTDSSSDGNYRVNIASLDNCVNRLDGCARVRVEPSSTITSPIIITSEGTAGTNIRKIQVDVILDSSGAIISTTWIELKTLPLVSTGKATDLGSGTATLRGWINPNGNPNAKAWFRYGTTKASECSDVFGGGISTLEQSITPGNPANLFPNSFSQTIMGLSAGTIYYYCAIASDGTATNKVYGNIFGFVAQ